MKGYRSHAARVTAECAQQFAAFDLPELAGLVETRRSDHPSIGGKSNTGYIIEMTVEDAAQAARGGFPEADGLVGAARCDQPPVGTEGDAADVIEVTVLNDQLRLRRFQRRGRRAPGPWARPRRSPAPAPHGRRPPPGRRPPH